MDCLQDGSLIPKKCSADGQMGWTDRRIGRWTDRRDGQGRQTDGIDGTNG